GMHRSGRGADARSTLQPLVALAVVAAALLDPLQAAVAVVGLVGIVLIEAGVQPRLAGTLTRIFGRDRRRERRTARRSEARGGRGAGSGLVTRALIWALGRRLRRTRRRTRGRRRRCAQTPFRLADAVPIPAPQAP